MTCRVTRHIHSCSLRIASLLHRPLVASLASQVHNNLDRASATTLEAVQLHLPLLHASTTPTLYHDPLTYHILHVLTHWHTFHAS